jgi:DHA2 family multidrug resistance protein
VAWRTQFHQVHLVSRVSEDDPALHDQLQGITRQFEIAGTGEYQAEQQAYAGIYKTMQDEAHTLAFIDAYWVLVIGALVMLCLTFLLKRNDPRAACGPTGH